MTGFELRVPQRISFGPGTASELRGAVAPYGPRVLVVTGSRPARVRHVVEGLGPHRTVSVSGEPTVQDVRGAVAAAQDFDADTVVAIGGGSVIDLAKATAMLLGNGGDPLDYLEVVGRGLPITRPSVPLVALPTTAGTGAEVTANAVLAVPEEGLKASLRSPFMLPRHAIVDPDLTVDCPQPVTASAGMDALTQCLEPYVSRLANPVTDAWARTGLMAAGRSLRRAYDDGADREARTGMALASLLGGLALANAKLGAVHALAGIIGGMAAAPHGAACAALLVPVCRANADAAPVQVRQRFEDVGRWLTGDPDADVAAGLGWLDRTRSALAIPGLAAFGLREPQADDVAGKALRASSMRGNPVDLTQQQLADAFRAAL